MESLYIMYIVQCCPKMVARLPNVTHKHNGRPIVACRVVRFTTSEFSKYFSPTLFYICDIEISCTCCKTSYLKISHVSWTLKLSKLWGCVLKYSKHVLWNNIMTGMAWQHYCWATYHISKNWRIRNINLTLFCYWLKMNLTLWNCCFIVITDHINIYGPPKCYTDHPANQRGWSVGRPRIL